MIENLFCFKKIGSNRKENIVDKINSKKKKVQIWTKEFLSLKVNFNNKVWWIPTLKSYVYLER